MTNKQELKNITMEKVFTRKHHGNKKWIVLLLAVVCICVSCSKKQTKDENDGMILTKFEITDERINEILDTAISLLRNHTDKDVFILEAMKIDTMSVFVTAELSKKTISRKYIFENNKRILGYTERHGYDFMLLTTTQDLYSVIDNYSSYFVPTDSSRFFDYIYFPNYMYNKYDYRAEKPAKGWGDPYIAFYDPIFCIYVYEKSRNKWFFIFGSNNVSSYLNKDSINLLKERVDIYYDKNDKFIPPKTK